MATPSTASARPEQVATVRSAASALADLLPSAVPLHVVEHDAAAGPGVDATAVRATFVGDVSADLVLVADPSIAAALAGPETAISVADALRPALEAAAAKLGTGVLDHAEVGTVDGALDAPDVVAIALADADGVRHAWFCVRLRPAPEAVPHQRGPAAAERPADPHEAMRLLQDVEMVLTAEIGRTKLPVRQVLDLVPGTVLELDRPAGSPADLMVNGRLVARGEIVVVDEDYGIRITEIVAAEKG